MCTQPPSQWTPAFFPGGKATGCEVDHSPPSSAEVKNEWNYNSVPCIYLYGADRDTFTFNFMFEFPCIISLYYIKNQQDATLAVLFISNCKITLHVSDAFCVHQQEY